MSDRTKTRTIYRTVTTTPKSAVPTEEGDAARTSQRVGLAMADPTTRRALLGVPSDVFATWHDPHAEVRGRALAADPALPRGQPLRQSSRRSSRLTPPPSPPRRTSRTRAWPRPTASSRSSRSRSSRASTRAFPSTGASPSLARRTFQIHLDRFSFLRLLQRRLVVRACFFTRLKKKRKLN